MIDDLSNLKKIEGFPQGDDEELLSFSYPPIFTAYPNPHFKELIQTKGHPYNESEDTYQCDPYEGDISASDQNPIYAAHAYHTKVPPDIISTLISHYSKQGDIILDVFCGTGMTGVAARDLGRNCLLIDLSPIATFVSWVNTDTFETYKALQTLETIIRETENELGYLYETQDNQGHKGIISYTVWSDVFNCPYCNYEFPFFPHGVEHLHGKVRTLDNFPCPKCGADLNVRSVKRIISSDGNKKKAMVWVNCKSGTRTQDRAPSKFDLELAQKIENAEIPYWYPTDAVNPDWYSARLGQLGQKKIDRVDKFLSRRNLWVYSALFSRVQSINDTKIRAFCTYALTGLFTVISERQGYFGGGGGMSGNLYMPIIRKEQNIFICLKRRLSKVKSAELFKKRNTNSVFVGTQSSTDLVFIPDNSIDYIYIDPPFGANIIYSEMNSILEGWIKVKTNITPEAVINDYQNKDIQSYRELILKTFIELFRVLKPGRWITVEFHNTQAAIWNLIQDCLMKAGFVVAQTGTLDKGSSTILQDIRPGAVNNDIIISAFKPKITIATKLSVSLGKDVEAEFITEYLRQLPIHCVSERRTEMLYSRYLAYYIKHGFIINYNSDQFYNSLTEWGMEERDGYWFVDEIQANEYEKRKARNLDKDTIQAQPVLFINDEKSARQWIWNFLDEPKSYDAIYTKFVQALQTSEDEIPELMTILNENFVRTNGHWKKPDQLTQVDLEARRRKRLLEQFNEYLSLARSNQKLREIRIEAVLVGFTESYRAGRYQEILAVGNKIDKNLLETNPDIYDFIDIAEAKVNG